MPRQTIRYQPALDGVRALAVTAVLLFHGRLTWMSGGYLGVSVFFTLSGFLITSLLLVEHEHSGTIDARAFYTRRAKRLLPASLVCLAAVSILAAAGRFKGVANLRRDVLGALFQVFNWVKLGSGESYADLTAAQAGLRRPLDHYWSLAIEEQFYWIWPVAFLGVIVLCRRRGWRPLHAIAVLVLAFGIAAPVIAQVWGANAAYWATPARISEILFGALVACFAVGRTLPARVALLAPVCLVALGAACVLFPDGHGPAYQGALPLVGLASAGLILGLQSPGPVRALLSVKPLVALGKVSYGVYLYHWPVYVLIDRQQLDLGRWPVLLIKWAITGALATVSYFAIERPVRRSNWVVPRRALVGAVVGSAVVVGLVIGVVPTSAKYYGVDASAASQVAIGTDSVAPLTPVTTVPATSPPATDPVVSAVTSTIATTTTQLVPPRPVRIVVAGDSTAEATGAGLVQWAAANPALAQVSLVTGPGCGLALGGYLVFSDSVRNVDKECGPYVRDILPTKVAALHPDVVVLMTTTWDVADRRLTKNGPVLSPVDAAAHAAIAASYTALTEQLLSLGVSRVVWIHEPVPPAARLGPADRQGDPARHQVLYDIMDSLASTHPAVRIADLATWTQQVGIAQDGAARPDAVHWAPEVSLRIADEFLGPLLVQAALT